MLRVAAVLFAAVLSLDVGRIYRAFGISESEQVELVASPEHRAFQDAWLVARESERAFVAEASLLAERVSADLNSALVPGATVRYDPSG